MPRSPPLLFVCRVLYMCRGKLRTGHFVLLLSVELQHEGCYLLYHQNKTLRTVLSTAPWVDATVLGQHHNVVVSTGNLADTALLEKHQKHRLQNFIAHITINTNAAVIVWPEHVQLIFVCIRRSRIFLMKILQSSNRNVFRWVLNAFLTHPLHRQWSRPHMQPAGLPSPEASPPSSAAGTTPGPRAPAGPPFLLLLAHPKKAKSCFKIKKKKHYNICFTVNDWYLQPMCTVPFPQSPPQNDSLLHTRVGGCCQLWTSRASGGWISLLPSNKPPVSVSSQRQQEFHSLCSA